MTRIAVIAIAGAIAVTVGVALGHSGGGVSPSTKVITGSNHADVLTGTRHRDRIDGRKGADRIVGGGAPDLLVGGKGPDVIRARDRHQDTVDCGPGKDVAVVDRAENGVYDCEHVRFPKPSQKGGK
jgi:Ca2+-binding RTX toxin-like protein